MEVSDTELRKMLNEAWDIALERGYNEGLDCGASGGASYIYKDARYRDVSKILKESIPKPRQWDNLEQEEK